MQHYVRLSLEPRCSDALLIRKALQDALQNMFGLVSSTYIDVLFVNELGSEAVIRVHPDDVQKVMAGGASIGYCVVKASSFLPSL